MKSQERTEAINMISWLLAISLSYAIHIKSIVPTGGPLTGNTRVLVRGTDLEPQEAYPNPVCKFGTSSNIVKATYVKCSPKAQHPDEPDPTTEEKTDHCLECDDSPPYDYPDMIPVTVSITGDFMDVDNSMDFVYYTPPKVNKIIPPYGPKNGGTIVTVYGENFIDFDQYLRCSFGTKDVAAVFISDDVLQCSSPFSDVVMAAQPFRVTMNDQQTTRDDVNYWYYPNPEIDKLIPNRGSTAGGNDVEIEGKNLDPFNDMLDTVNNHNDTLCQFGEYLTPARVLHDLKVVCVAPPSPMPRTVIVDVTLNRADHILNPLSWTDDHLPYTYYAPPLVFDIDPKVGPTTGDTMVVIKGNNFSDTGQIKCKFGEEVVPGEYISDTEIHCQSPETLEPGIVDLSLSLGEDEFSVPVKYLYYASPEVLDFTPICGPTTGYTQISVYGKNFIFTGKDLIFCIFDDVYTPATVMSSTEIKCDSPDITSNKKLLKEMKAPVAITLDKKEQFSANKNFSYYEFHTLTGINPSKGPITGNTNVVMYGKDFDQPGVCNVTVRFGTTEVLSLSHNHTAVVADTPPVKVSGNAIVQVSLNGQQFTDSIGGNNVGATKGDDSVLYYEYYQRPMVTSFYPHEGPSSGNATVIIEGAGLVSTINPEVYIKFKDGEKEVGLADCYYLSVNKLECLTPAGTKDHQATLYISNNNKDYDEIQTGKYTYKPSPSVTDIEPKFGPVKQVNDTTLTVKGTNFYCSDDECSELACRFGTHPYPVYTSASLISSKEIECDIPQLSRPEKVTVEISPNGKDFTSDSNYYTYYDAFVLDIFPKFGKPEGDTTISVMGFGFADTGSGIICRYGQDDILCDGKACEIEGTYISDTEIECPTFPKSSIVYKDTGENIGLDPFDVEVSIIDGVYTESHLQFAYMIQPDYLEMDPDHGTAKGGTYVIMTTDFHWSNANDTEGLDYATTVRDAIVRCKFTGSNSTATVPGDMITYPFSEGELPNAIAFIAPSWEFSETVTVQASINGEDFSQEFSYTFTERLLGKSLSPACGPNKGNTPVAIEGTGFADTTDLHLKWGTQSTLLALSEEVGILTSHSPITPTNNTHGGFLYVEIGHNSEVQETTNQTYTFYEDYTADKLLYYYYKEPVLQYIFPKSGPDVGGTEVVLAGAWFINYPGIHCTPLCRFGDTITAGEFVSTVRILCTSPPKPGFAGSVPVDISFNGEDWTDGSHTFVYYKEPVIDSIRPIFGPSGGGSMVTILGHNFTGGLPEEDFLCRFSGGTDKTVKAFYVSEGEIQCIAPGGWGVGSETQVDLTFNGRDYTNSNQSYYFYKVDTAAPLSGPLIGSPLGISVLGSGFIPNNQSLCIIDGEKYEPIRIDTDRIVCPMPPSDKAAVVSFVVSANGVDSYPFPEGFAYYKQSKVTLVEPKSGPVSGGSLVKIYGEDFRNDFRQANVTCRFGEYAVQGEVLDTHTIQCLSPEMARPANASGLPLQISLNGQDYTTNPDLFQAYGISSIAPKSGPINGGTEVYVKGFGFNGESPSCRFGVDSNYLEVPAKKIDDTRMVCVSPTGFKIPSFAALPLDVPFEIGFGPKKFHPWTKTENKYRFYEKPKILGFSPHEGWVDESVSVYVTADPAKGFFPAITGWNSPGELDLLHAIVCKFGEFGVSPATYLNSTMIVCVTPETHLKRNEVRATKVPMEVALNGNDFSDIGDYTFKGTGSAVWVILMWLLMILLIVAILLLLGVCCYYVWFENTLVQKDKKASPDRLHVLRDEDGVVRPRGQLKRDDEMAPIGE